MGHTPGPDPTLVTAEDIAAQQKAEAEKAEAGGQKPATSGKFGGQLHEPLPVLCAPRAER